MHLLTICFVIVFFLMIRRPPRSTRTDNSFPTRRSSDLHGAFHRPQGYRSASVGEEHQHGHHHTNRATTGSWAGSARLLCLRSLAVLSRRERESRFLAEQGALPERQDHSRRGQFRLWKLTRGSRMGAPWIWDPVCDSAEVRADFLQQLLPERHAFERLAVAGGRAI